MIRLAVGTCSALAENDHQSFAEHAISSPVVEAGYADDARYKYG